MQPAEVMQMSRADFEREEQIDDLAKVVTDDTRPREKRLAAHRDLARLIAERPDHVVEFMEKQQGLK